MRSLRWIKSRWNIIPASANLRNGHADLGRGRAVWPSITAAAIGLVLSISVWLAVSGREDRQAEQRLSARANDHALILQHGIEDYVDDLAALQAYFQSSEKGVSRREFTVFSESILRNKAAILSLAWIPRV